MFVHLCEIARSWNVHDTKKCIKYAKYDIHCDIYWIKLSKLHFFTCIHKSINLHRNLKPNYKFSNFCNKILDFQTFQITYESLENGSS